MSLEYTINSAGHSENFDFFRDLVHSEMPYERKCIFLFLTDGPATINVNIYLRTISRIDDVKMVRGQKNCTVEGNCMRHKTVL